MVPRSRQRANVFISTPYGLTRRVIWSQAIEIIGAP